MNEARMTKKRGPFGAVLAAALACGLALCCLGCENALATEAASLQAKASSPVIGLSDASSSAVSSGGVLTFADTAAGNTRSLVVKVENSGKADLAIGGSGVEIAMSSGTEAGSFSILSQPVSSIPRGEVRHSRWALLPPRSATKSRRSSSRPTMLVLPPSRSQSREAASSGTRT